MGQELSSEALDSLLLCFIRLGVTSLTGSIAHGAVFICSARLSRPAQTFRRQGRLTNCLVQMGEIVQAVARTLLGGDAAHPIFPPTAEMQVVEHYKRTNYGSLEFSLTVVDPKVFTTPWTTASTISLHPNAEISEYFCVPSDSIDFNNRNTIPAY